MNKSAKSFTQISQFKPSKTWIQKYHRLTWATGGWGEGEVSLWNNISNKIK